MNGMGTRKSVRSDNRGFLSKLRDCTVGKRFLVVGWSIEGHFDARTAVEFGLFAINEAGRIIFTGSGADKFKGNPLALGFQDADVLGQVHRPPGKDFIEVSFDAFAFPVFAVVHEWGLFIKNLRGCGRVGWGIVRCLPIGVTVAGSVTVAGGI